MGNFSQYRKDVLLRVSWEQVYGELKGQKDPTNNWVSCFCPFHSDHKTRSFSFNKVSLGWTCFAKCGNGDVVDFVKKMREVDFTEALQWLGDLNHISREEIEGVPKPPLKEEMIQQYVDALRPEDRQYLGDKRGLVSETIQEYKIGFVGGKAPRISIPVYDDNAELVNIRRYRESEKDGRKMINYTKVKPGQEGKKKKDYWGYGSPARLWPLDKMLKTESDEVIFCEGEWDCILLRQYGFNAVTGTAGCRTFYEWWVKWLIGKDVVLIYDYDEAGRQAVSGSVLPLLRRPLLNGEINSLKVVWLPLKGTKEDNDVGDYFLKHENNPADLRQLITTTPYYQYIDESDEEIHILDSFRDIDKNKYMDKLVKVRIVAMGDVYGTYGAIKTFNVHACPEMKKDNCNKCTDTIVVPDGHKSMIACCKKDELNVISIMKLVCCDRGVRRQTIELKDKITVKTIIVHQVMEVIDELGEMKEGSNNFEEREVFLLSEVAPEPGTYEAIGYVRTSPTDSSITMLITSMVKVEDDYKSFILKDKVNILEEYRKLSINEVVSDISTHVTNIYARDDLLKLLMLTYCSVRWFNFNGQLIRGWLFTGIMGDSGSAKSQLYETVFPWLDLGACIQSQTSSRTGIIYFLSQVKNTGTWVLRMGKYPLNHGKFLVVDEAHLLPQDEEGLRAFTSGISQGKVEITRAVTRTLQTETRLMFIFNPAKDKGMSRFLFGCQSLSEVMSGPMIRRMDLCCFANRNDIKDKSRIDAIVENLPPQKVSAEMMKSVIYWAWNLKPKDVEFSKKAIQAVMYYKGTLSREFGFALNVPLVFPDDFRHTLARLSVAWAVFSGSGSPGFKKLLVRPEHVAAVSEYLFNVYSAKNCRLDKVSNFAMRDATLADYGEIRERFLKKQIDGRRQFNGGEPSFVRVLHCFYERNSLTKGDLLDLTGCGKDSLEDIISWLNGKRLIFVGKGKYEMKAKLVDFFQEFLEDETYYVYSRNGKDFTEKIGAVLLGKDGKKEFTNCGMNYFRNMGR